MSESSSMQTEAYEIVSVRPAETPPDMEGGDWHCYVIAQGSNTIRGFRPGSLRTVTRAVEEIVVQLNERRFGKRARTHRAKSELKKPVKK